MENHKGGDQPDAPRKHERGKKRTGFVAEAKRRLKERRTKRQQETPQDRAARRSSFATVCMAVFACVALIVGCFQFIVMRGQLEVLENQTAVMTAQVRPWLTVEMDKGNFLSVNKDGSTYQAFNLVVKNVGSGPAMEALVWTKLMPAQAEGFPVSIFAEQDVLCGRHLTPESLSIFPFMYGFSLFPGQERTTIAVASLSAKDIRSTAKILKGRPMNVVLIGCVVYQFYTNPNLHETRFAFDLEKASALATNATPPPVRVGESVPAGSLRFHRDYWGNNWAN